MEQQKKTKAQRRYESNKAAKVGTEITCPSCKGTFIKKSYQQAFCCGVCKDRYHNKRRTANGYFRDYNMAHPERLERIGHMVGEHYDIIECDHPFSEGAFEKFM